MYSIPRRKNRGQALTMPRKLVKVTRYLDMQSMIRIFTQGSLYKGSQAFLVSPSRDTTANNLSLKVILISLSVIVVVSKPPVRYQCRMLPAHVICQC